MVVAAEPLLISTALLCSAPFKVAAEIHKTTVMETGWLAMGDNSALLRDNDSIRLTGTNYKTLPLNQGEVKVRYTLYAKGVRVTIIA